MRILKSVFAALVLVLGTMPALAQYQGVGQAEGTGADLVFETSINGSAFDQNDKTMCPGDLLTMRLATPGLTFVGKTVAIAGDVGPVSLDINEFGVVGTGVNRFAIINSLFNPLGVTIPGSGNLELNVVVPALPLWNDGGPFFPGGAPDLGLFLQGGCENFPTGTFLGYLELTNTVKLEVLESPDPGSGFADDCAEAALCDGLSDADLGIPQIVDVSVFNNDYETTGTTGFAQTTAFSVVGPGMGSGVGNSPVPDAVVKFTATGGGNYTFDLCASNFDTRIWLMTTNCAAPVGIVIDDDFNPGPPACGANFTSRLQNICLAAGQEVMLVIEGCCGNTGVANMVITKIAIDAQSLTPTNGTDAGGTTVTINGCNLAGVNSVTFGGNAAAINFTTATSVEVVTPAGSGSVDVVVSDGFNSDTLVGAFTYLASNAPPCSMPNLFLPDGPVVSDNLSVSYSAAIVDLDVQVILTHTWTGDLLIDLTSPALTTVRLENGDNGNSDNINTVYDDEAPAGESSAGGVSPASCPVDGPGTLADFDGQDIQGTWTMTIDDIAGGDTGTLSQWCLFATLATTATSNTPVPIQDGILNTGSQSVAVVTPIDNLKVGMSITHTWTGDIEMDLTSPAATIVRLEDADNGNSDNINTVYDDAAAPGESSAGNVSPASCPVDGPGLLADFLGENAAGLWLLDLFDVAGGDTGAVNAWSLIINQ
jgi:subtilisin-like proprotein convertase family protein